MRSKSINKPGHTPLRVALLAGATALALAAVSGVAQANLTYTLNNANSGLSGASGPFGTVVLTDGTGTNGIGIGTVQVQELISNTYTANTKVATGQFEFNMSTKPTITGILFQRTNANVTPPTSSGSLIASTKPSNTTVGSLDWAITCGSCATGSSAPQYNKLTFDATATGGLAATDFTSNTKSIYFLADIYNSTVGSTGYVWTTTPDSSVPEPGSLSLLGAALVGLWLVARRRRRNV